MSDLLIDEKLQEIVRSSPGISQNRAATALIENYSITYSRNRIVRLVAQGKIRSEVDRSGRYKLFVVDKAPMPAV